MACVFDKSKSRARSTGKRFETEIANSIRYLDEPCLMCRPDDIVGERFTNKKPGDFIMLWRGMGWLLECKTTASVSFPYGNIRQHQIDFLYKAHNSGNAGILIIALRKNRKTRCWAIPIKKWGKKPDDRKSIPVEWFEEHGLELERIKFKLPGRKNECYGWDIAAMGELYGV